MLEINRSHRALFTSSPMRSFQKMLLETIVSKLPLGRRSSYMHPFIIGADGSMYVDVATATNSCQAKNRQPKIPGDNPVQPNLRLVAASGVMKPTKTNQMFSPAERYATGIRNAEGFAFDSTGRDCFVTQHGRETNCGPELAGRFYKPAGRRSYAGQPAEELDAFEVRRRLWLARSATTTACGTNSCWPRNTAW